MWTFFTWLLTAVVGLVQDVVVWLIELLAVVWAWLVALVIQIFNELWIALKSLIPADVEVFFSSVDLNAFLSYFYDASWILPVAPCLALVATAYGLCATIRTCRWVKSCIPTISGA